MSNPFQIPSAADVHMPFATQTAVQSYETQALAQHTDTMLSQWQNVYETQTTPSCSTPSLTPSSLLLSLPSSLGSLSPGSSPIGHYLYPSYCAPPSLNSLSSSLPHTPSSDASSAEHYLYSPYCAAQQQTRFNTPSPLPWSDLPVAPMEIFPPAVDDYCLLFQNFIAPPLQAY